jgi:DNA invertase Pin-like site-specific DNA recombinase
LRKSAREDEAQSFARQRGSIAQWAEANGVALAEEFSDAGVSGAKHWRERQLGEAIAAVERGEAAGIIVEELSRLTRGSSLHSAELWDALDQAKARLVVTAEGIDTARGDQELNFGLRALLAREQHKQYARRMADFKKRKTADGVAFGPMPLGYRKDADGRAEVDPAKAPIVRELYERRLKDESISSLTRWLREQTGREWTRQAVTFILANPLYHTGRVSYGEYVSDHEAGAIVEPELFHAVQRGKHPSRRGPARHLLAGSIFCGRCEEKMQTVLTKGGMEGKPKYRYYRCLNPDCLPTPRPGARGEVIEEWVVETIWTFLGSRMRRPNSAPDLVPLQERVALTEALYEQARTPEMQLAYGADAPSVITARRQDYEAALTALGEAEAQDVSTDDLIDLRERWPEMTDQERREQLHRFHVARVMVSGRTPDAWEIVWK